MNSQAQVQAITRDPAIDAAIRDLKAIEAAVKADSEQSLQSYQKITDELMRFRVHQAVRLYGVRKLMEM